jgi:hypothetical protein
MIALAFFIVGLLGFTTARLLVWLGKTFNIGPFKHDSIFKKNKTMFESILPKSERYLNIDKENIENIRKLVNDIHNKDNGRISTLTDEFSKLQKGLNDEYTRSDKQTKSSKRMFTLMYKSASKSLKSIFDANRKK